MNCMPSMVSTRLALVAGLTVLVGGCSRADIKVYRVAKEGSVAQQPGIPSDGMSAPALPEGHPDVAGASAPRLTWKTPEGWTEVAPGQMRVASFSIKSKDGKQADVSVIPLPGGAGGDVANVNRWRAQLGLSPLTPEELQKSAQKVEIAAEAADLFDIAGKNPGSGEATRILGAIQHREGTAWFFKMTGDDEVVAQQKSAFIEFLKSLKFAAEGAGALPPSHPPMEGGTLPAGHPDISASPAADAATSGEAKPNWRVPMGWKEVPGGQFLVAKFVITSAGDAQAAVNVSRSAGDGGGLLANVNRWRQQLGLAPVDDAALSPLATSLEVAGGKATVVELAGADARSGQPARLVGAMVPRSGETWFYKLMGNGDIVEREKDAFTGFVQGVKY